jgi:adsorption protein B
MLDPTLRLACFINIVLLINRLAQRMIFTTSIHGVGQGLIATPRVVFSNFINFYAALRALLFMFGDIRRITNHTIPSRNIKASKPAQNQQERNPGLAGKRQASAIRSLERIDESSTLNRCPLRRKMLLIHKPAVTDDDRFSGERIRLK